MRLGETVRRTAAVVVLAVVPATGCREPAPSPERTEAPRGPTGMPLDNAEFSILEMATAHDAFTIEVEVDADADTQVISRQLVEPIHTQYSEVLVYFYDRAGDGELPMRRVQWTEAGGYDEIEY